MWLTSSRTASSPRARRLPRARASPRKRNYEDSKHTMSTVIAPVTHPVRLTERINRIEPSATMAAVAEAEKLRQQGIDVVDMTAGEPHFSTPQHVKDAALAAIQNNFSTYTAHAAPVELKDAITPRHAPDFAPASK